MQEPANMALDLMRQVEEMKHASIVFQFQSMEILHPPPISMSLIAVEVGIIVEDVMSGPILMVDDAIDMSMFSIW